MVQTVTGFSGVGTPVSFHANLSIAGDILTIQLYNDSTQSLAPADVLSSYYFDIVNGSNARPTMTYQSATGDVWLTSRTHPDVLQQANANLMALAPGDNTWQFRTMNNALNPFLGFGLGTVGNSSLAPNNFNGNIVGGLDYSIYAGDVTTQNLNNTLLVKDHITFTFSGLTGFSEADISPRAAFGLGTAPDSMITVPEPTTLALIAAGGAAVLRRRRRS